MALRRRISGQRGFTLIELLVVVAILGILAGIAVPRIIGAIDSARDKRAVSDLATLRDSLERYYLDFGLFPISLYVLQEKNYVDPDFSYLNAYGNRYMYAVRVDGDYSAIAVATDPLDPDDFKDYWLGDPGQTPPTVGEAIADPNLIYCPEGSDPATADAYFFGAGAVPAGDMIINVVDLNMVPTTMTATLVVFDGANPTVDYGDTCSWVRFRGL